MESAHIEERQRVPLVGKRTYWRKKTRFLEWNGNARFFLFFFSIVRKRVFYFYETILAFSYYRKEKQKKERAFPFHSILNINLLPRRPITLLLHQNHRAMFPCCFNASKVGQLKENWYPQHVVTKFFFHLLEIPNKNKSTKYIQSTKYIRNGHSQQHGFMWSQPTIAKSKLM